MQDEETLLILVHDDDTLRSHLFRVVDRFTRHENNSLDVSSLIVYLEQGDNQKRIDLDQMSDYHLDSFLAELYLYLYI